MLPANQRGGLVYVSAFCTAQLLVDGRPRIRACQLMNKKCP